MQGRLVLVPFAGAHGPLVAPWGGPVLGYARPTEWSARSAGACLLPNGEVGCLGALQETPLGFYEQHARRAPRKASVGGARTVASERRARSKAKSVSKSKSKSKSNKPKPKSKSRSKSGSRRGHVDRNGLYVGAQPIARRSSPCPKGQVLRRSFERTGKGGEKVRVPAKCQKGRGLSEYYGKAVKTGIAAYKLKHAGILTSHGYSQSEPSATKRRAAIMRAVHAWKPGQPEKANALGLYRHMNVIMTRSRNRTANRAGLLRFAADMNWLAARVGINNRDKTQAVRRSPR